MSLFINALRKHPNFSYGLSHEVKDWRCNKNLYTRQRKSTVFLLFSHILSCNRQLASWAEVSQGCGALALGSRRQAEHRWWPGHSDRGPRALSPAWNHLEFTHSNLLLPKGESITLNRLRKGARCQLRPKKGPSKPLVKSPFIPSPNPISWPLKLSFTQWPEARTECPSNTRCGQEPYLAFPTHLSVRARWPWCVQAS